MQLRSRAAYSRVVIGVQSGSTELDKAWLWAAPPSRRKREAYLERVESLPHRGRLCPQPLRIPAREFAAWTVELPALLALARRVALDVAAPDATDRLTRLAEKWRHRPRMPPTMRADGLLTKKGLRLCELNMGPGAGGAWQTAFMCHWLGVRPDPRDGIRAAMQQIVRRRGGGAVVGVLDELGRGGDAWYETQDLLAWLEGISGVRAHYVPTASLRRRQGKMVDRHRAYDLLYQTDALGTRSPIDREIRIVDQVAESSTELVVDPLDVRIDDKAIIAVLSAAAAGECDFRLSAGERRLVLRYLPWTRLLGDGPATVPVRTAIERRERLILKRTRSLNSLHVVPGYELSAREWKRALDQALRSRFRWLVQERLVAEPQLVETPIGVQRRACMVCPFVFGAKWAGALVRIAEPEPRPFHIAGRPSIFLTVAASA